MNVYRIESKTNGKGPFQNLVCKPQDYDPPGPADDGIFGSAEDYWDLYYRDPTEMKAHRYGFADKDQLTNWFSTESLIRILKKDHVVAKYEVPDEKVKIGGHQCAFKLKDAKLKGWVPVRELKTMQ